MWMAITCPTGTVMWDTIMEKVITPAPLYWTILKTVLPAVLKAIRAVLPLIQRIIRIVLTRTIILRVMEMVLVGMTWEVIGSLQIVNSATIRRTVWICFIMTTQVP